MKNEYGGGNKKSVSMWGRSSWNQINILLTVSGGKAGVAIVSLITAALIAANYGQEGLGVFALLRVTPMVFMVLTDPGFSHAIPYLQGNKKVDRGEIIGGAASVYIPVVALQVGLWVLITPLIHEYLLSSLSRYSIYMAAVIAPMQALMIALVNLLRAKHQYNLANLVFLIAEAMLLMLSFFAWIIDEENLSSLVYIIIFSSLAALFCGAAFASLSYRGKPRVNVEVVREGLRFGLKSQIGNAFQILNYRLDHLLVGFFLTPEKVAVYFVATKSAEFFRFFTASIMFVYEPILARQVAEDAKIKVKKALGPLLVTNGILLSVGVLLAPYLFPLVLGEWSYEANGPLIILAAGLIVSGGNTILGAYFLGQGFPGVTTLASLAGLIVTGMFSILLIPKYGVTGAAITSSVAYAVVTLVYISVFFKD